jgi:hypothetical protein
MNVSEFTAPSVDSSERQALALVTGIRAIPDGTRRRLLRRDEKRLPWGDAEDAAAAPAWFGTEEERKVRGLVTRERLVPTDDPT